MLLINSSSAIRGRPARIPLVDGAVGFKKLHLLTLGAAGNRGGPSRLPMRLGAG